MKLPPADAPGLSPREGRPEDSYSKGVKNPAAGLKQLGSSVQTVKLTAIDGYIATGNALSQVKVGRMELRNLKLPTIGVKLGLLLTAGAAFFARDGVGRLAHDIEFRQIDAAVFSFLAYRGNRAMANALWKKKEAVDASNDPNSKQKFDKTLKFWTGPGRYAANGIMLWAAFTLATATGRDFPPIAEGILAFFVAASMWGITGMSRFMFTGAAQQILDGKPRPGSKLGFLKRSKAPSKDVPAHPVAPTPTPSVTDGPEL